MHNLFLRQLEELGNVGGHVQHRALLLRANVVDLAGDALVQDHIEGLGHILHKEVAACGNACRGSGGCPSEMPWNACARCVQPTGQPVQCAWRAHTASSTA